MELFIDYTTNTSPWWEAARVHLERMLEIKQPTAGQAAFLRVMCTLYDRWGSVCVEVDDEDARAFEVVAATLPGWNDGPVAVQR